MTTTTRVPSPMMPLQLAVFPISPALSHQCPRIRRGPVTEPPTTVSLRGTMGVTRGPVIGPRTTVRLRGTMGVTTGEIGRGTMCGMRGPVTEPHTTVSLRDTMDVTTGEIGRRKMCGTINGIGIAGRARGKGSIKICRPFSHLASFLYSKLTSM
jgi:hypothetical protein